MKSSTLRKTTIEVVSSWFRKQQFALRVEAVIIRDFRGKQIAHRRNIFIQTTQLIADEPFVEVSAQASQQPSPNLDRNVNLKRKRQCKIWRFS